jgi:type IV pilus assembly protein PilA
MKKQSDISEKGFTLIEILIVIGIIAILASVVIIAINPARQFAQARDSQRISNLNAILNAIGQRLADNKGIFAGSVGSQICPTLPLTATKITTDTPAATTTSAALGCLVPTYISVLPTDPSGPTAPDTDYSVFVDVNGRVHVSAATQEPSIPRTTPLEVVR